jgi:hypothetical protein
VRWTLFFQYLQLSDEIDKTRRFEIALSVRCRLYRVSRFMIRWRTRWTQIMILVQQILRTTAIEKVRKISTSFRHLCVDIDVVFCYEVEHAFEMKLMIDLLFHNDDNVFYSLCMISTVLTSMFVISDRVKNNFRLFSVVISEKSVVLKMRRYTLSF